MSSESTDRARAPQRSTDLSRRSRRLTLDEHWTPVALAEAGTGPSGEQLLFDGALGGEEGWRVPQLIALKPRCVLRLEPADAPAVERALREIEALLAARRDDAADAHTGLAVLLSYEALQPYEAVGKRRTFPSIFVLAVDCSIVRSAAGGLLSVRASSPDLAERRLDRWSARLAAEPACREERVAATACGAATTSLPRDDYLAAVATLKRRIAEGQIYQANLCQRFDLPWSGDPLRFYERLAAENRVPHSAYLACAGLAVASLSPETFVTIRGRTIETLPIKGTRPRGGDARSDAAAAAELLASEKDRAELLMIVDLERNDLGRLCEPGSVQVLELATLRSYPTVHHLVARVRGQLRGDVGWRRAVRAIFPGGSISGAPKLRAMALLERIEPVERGPFTGSLFWCGDDGSVDSSILIRTAIFGPRVASIGAGGGIVTDSDPEAEWAESNHKARVLATGLGFDPEDLT